MRQVKVAVLQPAVKRHAVQENLAMLSRRLQRLAEQGVELAVLPEFFTTGNTLELELLRVAIDTSRDVDDWLREQSRSLNMIIAGAFLRLDEGDVYNTFVVQEPDGRWVGHRKVHSPAVEAVSYRVDPTSPHVLDTSLGKLGLIICAECFVEEIVREDFFECAMVLIAFAIPGVLANLPSIRNVLTRTPKALARRHGVPVALSSTGGPFESAGSPVFPFRRHGTYAGRSGLYLPTEILGGPLPPNADEDIVAEIPIGPRVAEPDPQVAIPAGLPLFIRLVGAARDRKAQQLYEANLAKWL